METNQDTMEFENAGAYIARTRPQTTPKVDWAEVRRNLPDSAKNPLIPLKRQQSRTFVVPTNPPRYYHPAGGAAAATPRSSPAPLTFDQVETLRECQNFWSLDKNTGGVSTNKTLVSSRGIAVNIRTRPSMQLLSLRAASLLTASQKARLPHAIQQKLPRYSTIKGYCYMHDGYEETCFLCRERQIICQAAKEQ